MPPLKEPAMCLLVFGVLLLSWPTQGRVGATPYDPGDTVQFKINTGSFSGITNATGAIARAAQVWYAYTNADVVLDYTGTTAQTGAQWVASCNDNPCTGTNLIVAEDFGHCSAYGSTQYCGSGTVCYTGEKQVFLIKINTRAACNFGWTAALPDGAGQSSLAATVAHELGHGFGLDGSPHASVPTALLNAGGAKDIEAPLYADIVPLTDYYGSRSSKSLRYTSSSNGYTWAAPSSTNIANVRGKVGIEFNGTPYRMVAHADASVPDFLSVAECEQFSGCVQNPVAQTVWHDFGTLIGPTTAYDWEGATAANRHWFVAWPEFFPSALILYAHQDESTDTPPYEDGTPVDFLQLPDGLGGALWARTIAEISAAYDPKSDRFYLAWSHFTGRDCSYARRAMSPQCDLYNDGATTHKIHNNKMLIASSPDTLGQYGWGGLGLHNLPSYVSREGVAFACANDANLTRNCVLGWVETANTRRIKLVTIGFNANGTIASISPSHLVTPSSDQADGAPDAEWSPSGWVLIWRGLSWDCADDGLIWYYSFTVNDDGTVTWGTRGNLGSSYKTPLSPTSATRKLTGTPNTKYIYYISY